MRSAVPDVDNPCSCVGPLAMIPFHSRPPAISLDDVKKAVIDNEPVYKTASGILD